MEKIAVIKVLPTKIWIESDMVGTRTVMLQHEGCEPFPYASFNYDYRYTSNSGTLLAAETLARQLGAVDPIEHRNSDWKLPTPEELRQQIVQLNDALAEMETKSAEVNSPILS